MSFHTGYWVRCDSCHTRLGVSSLGYTPARAQLTDQGWLLSGPYNDQCPDCAGKREGVTIGKKAANS